MSGACSWSAAAVSIGTLLLAPPVGSAASARQPPDGGALGRPAAIAAGESATVSLPAEIALLAAPEAAATVVLVLDVPVEVEVLERAEGWLRVRRGSVVGWVALRDDGVPAPFAPAPRARSLDPERRLQRLAEARAVLGGDALERDDLGAQLWITDVSRRWPPLSRLVEIATCLPAQLEARLGATADSAAGAPRPVVVLFARERDYREYVRRMGEIEGDDTGGHHADGVAVLYAGDRDEEDIAATLAHELVHLHNARAFPFALPAWLEEGLAQDFALAAAGSDGCPVPGAWPRLRVTERELVTGVAGVTEKLTRYRSSGEARAAACAVLAWRGGSDQPRLAELLELEREDLSAADGRARRYVAAAGLVRVLRDGGDERRRAAFRELLAGYGAGATPDLREVLASLSSSLAAIEREMVELLASNLEPLLCDARVAE